jgi:hypothetical protein
MEDNRILIIDKIKKFQNFIPLLAGVSYLFGFVVVNSFLSKYGISSTSIFDSEYLAAGLIFTLIFGVLFLSIFFSNKHLDKVSENLSDFYLPALMRVFLLSYTYCFLIIDKTDVLPTYIMIFNYIGIFIWFFFFIIVKVTKFPLWLKWMLLFIVAISSNVFVFIISKECRFLISLVFVYGILGIISIVNIYDKKYEKAAALGSIFGFISLAMLFGYGVYDNIAKRYGGGKPENITLLVDSQKINVIPDVIKISDGNMIKAQLLHSSDKEYSLKQDSILITLNKDIFVGYINNYEFKK